MKAVIFAATLSLLSIKTLWFSRVLYVFVRVVETTRREKLHKGLHKLLMIIKIQTTAQNIFMFGFLQCLCQQAVLRGFFVFNSPSGRCENNREGNVVNTDGDQFT